MIQNAHNSPLSFLPLAVLVSITMCSICPFTIMDSSLFITNTNLTCAHTQTIWDLLIVFIKTNEFHTVCICIEHCGHACTQNYLSIIINNNTHTMNSDIQCTSSQYTLKNEVGESLHTSHQHITLLIIINKNY